jgi:predicted ATPase
MITRIEIDGYKSFEDFTLDLPPFAVLVGANASRKSNLLEAVDLLGHLIRNESGQTLVDHGRRGGPKDLFRRSADGRPAEVMRIAAEVILRVPREHLFLKVEASVRYAEPPEPLQAEVALPGIRGRRSDAEWQAYVEAAGLSAPLYDLMSPQVPAWEEDQWPAVSFGLVEYRELREATKNWQIIEPSPKAMRVASSTFDLSPLAEDGKNLGAVLGRISGNPESWYDFRADAMALLPELADITVEANTDWDQWDVWLQHKHEHRMSPITVSAGTLRVLALLAAAHDPGHEGVLMFEEPENGLHPSRVPQLLSRLRARTTDRRTLTTGQARQTLVTTHSPVALAAALEEAPDSVIFLDTVTRFGDGQPPRRLTRARKVAEQGERGTFVTPLEVRKYLDPVGRYARVA